MPERPWAMTQTWHDLLFAHWPIDPIHVRALVPAAFELDLRDGMAWIGVVPFRMSNVTARRVPALPWISAFPELNVRTYVTTHERPGVYFFSLDAGRALAVAAARLLFNLPYFTATMTATPQQTGVRYRSARGQGAAVFEADYRPTGEPFHPVPGSLEYYLTERYCLYNLTRRGRPVRVDIQHPRWLLHTAKAEIGRNTMADAAGIALPAIAPVLHFSRRQDVVAWTPEPVR